MRHLPRQRRVPTIKVSTDTTTTGRRMFAVGRIRPAQTPNCEHCGDFPTVKIKVGEAIVPVTCIHCSPGADSEAVA